ncbi:MAG TPA: hypothetical protein VN226_05150 [Anaerolineales bacterium]|nr:hypothetical protein [Anaerolineales bacterium]
MKDFFFRLLFFFIFSLLILSCSAAQGPQTISPTETPSQVISSYPSGLEPISGEGIILSGRDLVGPPGLMIEKDGRYRFEWSIQSETGGKVTLINSNQQAEEMFARVVLLNLAKPSEGAMDIALQKGDYRLELNGLQGEWKFTFYLVEERDF